MTGKRFNAKDIGDFAEKLSEFFLLFDSMFLYEENAEEMLLAVKESLEEQINYNESALAVIAALGGMYDSGGDRAKVKETDALLRLVKARKEMRAATVAAHRNNANNAALLSGLFGL